MGEKAGRIVRIVGLLPQLRHRHLPVKRPRQVERPARDEGHLRALPLDDVQGALEPVVHRQRVGVRKCHEGAAGLRDAGVLLLVIDEPGPHDPAKGNVGEEVLLDRRRLPRGHDEPLHHPIGARLTLPRLHDVREPDAPVRLIVEGLEDERDIRRSIHAGGSLPSLEPAGARANGVGAPLALALHPLPAGDLAIAR